MRASPSVRNAPGVLEVTCLFLHNYGEGILVGSQDISVVARQGSADESGDLDRLRRELEKLYPGMKITIDVSPERIGE